MKPLCQVAFIDHGSDDSFVHDDDKDLPFGAWFVDVAPDGTAYTHWKIFGSPDLSLDELPDHEEAT